MTPAAPVLRAGESAPPLAQACSTHRPNRVPERRNTGDPLASRLGRRHDRPLPDPAQRHRGRLDDPDPRQHPHLRAGRAEPLRGDRRRRPGATSHEHTHDHRHLGAQTTRSTSARPELGMETTCLAATRGLQPRHKTKPTRTPARLVRGMENLAAQPAHPPRELERRRLVDAKPAEPAVGYSCGRKWGHARNSGGSWKRSGYDALLRRRSTRAATTPRKTPRKRSAHARTELIAEP